MGMGGKEMSKTFQNQNLLIHQESPFFPHDVKVSKRKREIKKERRSTRPRKNVVLSVRQFFLPSQVELNRAVDSATMR